MQSQEGLADQDLKYIELRRTKEMERLIRQIQAERGTTKPEQLEHELLLKERNSQAPNRRRHCGVAAVRVSPPVLIAPPLTAPSPTIPDSVAGDDDDSWDDETLVIPDTLAEGTNLLFYLYFLDSEGI